MKRYVTVNDRPFEPKFDFGCRSSFPSEQQFVFSSAFIYRALLYPGKFYLVPIYGFIMGTGKFPIQKCAIFCKLKEIDGIARRRTRVRRTSDSTD
jgi:hypothetical protein